MEIVAVTDRRLCTEPFMKRIGRVVSADVDMIVLREKDLSPEEYGDLAVSVKEICERHGVGFCVNGFRKAAADTDADALWISYADLKENGKPGNRNVWVSVHSAGEAADARTKGADALVYGNVFETGCKPGKAACGFEELDVICRDTDIPVYAIGGICTDNAAFTKHHGLRGICLMSAFMTSGSPEELARSLRISTS